MATTHAVKHVGGASVHTLTAGKNESSSAIEVGGARNLSVQFRRTTGSTQTATLEGSNNGVVWVTLHSVVLDEGAHVELTGQTAGLHQILERPAKLRLTVSNTADG